MKLFSIILRVLAVAGAAFCAFVWFDTKGKTTLSMEHMKDVPGETLQARTEKVPALLKAKADTERNLKSTTEKLKDTQGKLAEANTDLQNERDRMVQANNEIVKKNSQIRTLTAQVNTGKKTIGDKEAEVSLLKQEIINIKNASEPIIANLKKQIAQLESDIANKDTEMAEAIKKAEADAIAKMQQVVEIDEKTGKKIVKMVVKAEPYKATGEIAAVLKFDNQNKMFVINKGTNSGVNENQAIQLKRDGKFIANVMVVTSTPDMSVCSIQDMDPGIPETIEENDLMELCAAPVVESKEVKAAAKN